MPRKPRLLLPGATYHVHCRVARGEFVFEDDFEAIEFVETLRKVKELDGWAVFAWCLMTNHYSHCVAGICRAAFPNDAVPPMRIQSGFQPAMGEDRPVVAKPIQGKVD